MPHTVLQTDTNFRHAFVTFPYALLLMSGEFAKKFDCGRKYRNHEKQKQHFAITH